MWHIFLYRALPRHSNPSSAPYTYFVRKHSPLVIHDAISNDTSRATRIRNFNDFGADVNASALPQWSFITPNLLNDGHDTTIDYSSDWLEYFLVPLLNDTRFNAGEGKDGTLIVLTFDETAVCKILLLAAAVHLFIHFHGLQDYATRNNVFTLLLGSAVPKELHGTMYVSSYCFRYSKCFDTKGLGRDGTLYNHYSTLSTVEGNWGLDNLGRGDVNETLANVFECAFCHPP